MLLPFRYRLPLIVNGSGCALLPFRYGLPLIVNGSGYVLLSLRCGLPLIVNGSGYALLSLRYGLPLIVNGSVSTSFETTRNTLYKTQLPKVLHSVFRDLFLFFYFLQLLYNGFPEKASVFFRQMKKIFDSAKQREKQGYFQKKTSVNR